MVFLLKITIFSSYVKLLEGIQVSNEKFGHFGMSTSQGIHLPWIGDKIWQMFGRAVGNKISPTIIVFPTNSIIPMGISMEKLDGQFPSFQWRRSAALGAIGFAVLRDQKPYPAVGLNIADMVNIQNNDGTSPCILQWVNPLFLWAIFNSNLLVYQRVALIRIESQKHCNTLMVESHLHSIKLENPIHIPKKPPINPIKYHSWWFHRF